MPLTVFYDLRVSPVGILYISAEPIRARQASDTHINEVAKGLRLAGYDVTTCVTRVMGPYDNTPIWRRCVGYLAFWFQALKRLPRGTVVYARAHPANFVIALAAWFKGIPIIQEINGSYDDLFITHAWLSPLTSIITALQRFQYCKATALIAVTPQLADWVRQEAPGVPIATIPNGVNCEIFNPTRPRVTTVARNYALFYGSLTRLHGIEVMVAAAGHAAWPADLDLIIIGEGQLRRIAEQAAKQNSKIHILKSVPQESLVDYINGAVVGLVPINSVGNRGRFGLSPLKLYEMLACGLPVVVTDFPGQADLVRSLDAGIVVPPDDPIALAQAVSALHAAPPSRAAKIRVASIIKAEHSWINRIAEIERLLSSIGK
jgi:glycosyltransferase involved in cell wall biosynthesis